ncbi:MAG: type II toxin-antitoxin system VapC family toxin [Proteobacteria bacterium]|nr:type II toxin-antitoxin system VapC family toxin [Pseudomonadota bacterium]
MIIDTSVIIAILTNEPDRRKFNEAIQSSTECMMSVASFIETSIVIEARFGYDGVRDLDLFIAAAHIELSPVDLDQAHIARTAFRQFGKGRHPAKLNFGDCFTYALAKVTGKTLLHKGNDFSKTDISTFF